MSASGDEALFCSSRSKGENKQYAACQFYQIKFYSLTWNVFPESAATIQLIHNTAYKKKFSA